MTRSGSFAPYELAWTPHDLLGRWQVDESATVAAEATRFGVPPEQVREELARAGFTGVTVHFDADSFAVESAAPSEAKRASYTHAAGIPCGANELWLQFTWDEMMAQPYQYLRVTRVSPSRMEVEWPNDRIVQYSRAE